MKEIIVAKRLNKYPIHGWIALRWFELSDGQKHLPWVYSS
jgi:hypothetical protein